MYTQTALLLILFCIQHSLKSNTQLTALASRLASHSSYFSSGPQHLMYFINTHKQHIHLFNYFTYNILLLACNSDENKSVTAYYEHHLESSLCTSLYARKRQNFLPEMYFNKTCTLNKCTKLMLSQKQNILSFKQIIIPFYLFVYFMFYLFYDCFCFKCIVLLHTTYQLCESRRIIHNILKMIRS